jgi:hypothetical protein
MSFDKEAFLATHGKDGPKGSRYVTAIMSHRDGDKIVLTTTAGTTRDWAVEDLDGLRLRDPAEGLWRLVPELTQLRETDLMVIVGNMYPYDRRAVAENVAHATASSRQPREPRWFNDLQGAGWSWGWTERRSRCNAAAGADLAEARLLFMDDGLRFYWALERALVAMTGTRQIDVIEAATAVLDAF